MLNIGFSELLLIVVLALVFIGPKELPVMLRHIAKFMRELQTLGDDVKRQVKEVVRQAGIDDLATTTIIDLEGRKQQAYDVADLQMLGVAVKPPEAPAVPAPTTDSAFTAAPTPPPADGGKHE